MKKVRPFLPLLQHLFPYSRSQGLKLSSPFPISARNITFHIICYAAYSGVFFWYWDLFSFYSRDLEVLNASSSPNAYILTFLGREDLRSRQPGNLICGRTESKLSARRQYWVTPVEERLCGPLLLIFFPNPRGISGARAVRKVFKSHYIKACSITKQIMPESEKMTCFAAGLARF